MSPTTSSTSPRTGIPFTATSDGVVFPTGPAMTDAELTAHLVASRLAGSVATSPRSTVDNCGKLARGHPDYHFGLPDWRDATAADALAAVNAVCGCAVDDDTDLDGPGWIGPEAALAGINAQARLLAEIVAGGGSRVLLATGHPSGLLAHNATLGQHLRAAGSQLLTPLEDTWIRVEDQPGRMAIRYTHDVATAFDGASLRHTHRSSFMEAMLAELSTPPDLVIADHGMAGAAIAAGIPTLSIADVNDPGLPLAQVRGHTGNVLPIDDNLAPRLFRPVTARILGIVPEGEETPW